MADHERIEPPEGSDLTATVVCTAGADVPESERGPWGYVCGCIWSEA